MGQASACGATSVARKSAITRRGWIAGALAIRASSAERAPEVSAYDLSLLEDAPTPNELFFVREHNPAPRMSAASWRLSVADAVQTSLEITREDLLTLPRTRLPATLECAENLVGGGLVSHAVWEGVPLAELIARAKPNTAATVVRLEGWDGYSRVLPIEKARDGSVLIASRMNGELLPAAHGGPARGLVAGWYGMDSVKWLRSIELLTSAPPDSGDYIRRSRSLLAGVITGDPVRALLVKSVFSRPVNGALLRGRRFVVRGAAWAADPIAKVEISTDSGATWTEARVGKAERFCWAHWEWEWKVPATGQYSLIARATDAKGNAQPLDRDPSRVDPYEQNAAQRIQVTVR